MPPALHRLLAALLVLLASASLARAGDYDRWYTIDMGDKRAGWMHNSQVTQGELITTRNVIHFQLGRAEAAVSVGIEGEFVETAREGKPISMKSVLKMGNMPSTMVAIYGDKDIAVTLTQAGNTTQKTQPLPEGKWLTPAAATEFVRQRLAAKAATIEVRTIEPGGGLDAIAALVPATITHRDCRPEKLQVMGKTVGAVRCITTSTTQAGIESTEYLDELGLPIRSETSFGGLRMVATAATREEAKADRPGPELMISTFVKPDRPIKNPRQARKAAFSVKVSDGKLPAFPETGAQKYAEVDAKSGRLTVNIQDPQPAPAADATDAAFQAPSATINSDDTLIRKLTADALEKSGPEPDHRAEALRRFVHTFVNTKDLGVGFAAASEVARTRQGDCTEHAVLLAALLRSAGIPSRVACGLVYADQFAGAKDIFGYHMWAQALLTRNGKPTWVDLDATLGPETPFDATHIALAVSALADGQTQDALLAIASILGRLQIKVESIE